MKLLIVESPSKAKTIERYLDGTVSAADKYVVRASVGHVRDLPKSNRKAIDIEAGFVPHYEISKGKEHVVAELRRAAEKASEIILATDPDREGEAIAWHLKMLLQADKKIKAPIRRVVFYEITKEAILEALKNPRDIDTALRRAQEARRVLDRLVGYDLSGLIWKKVRYGLSAGRVQSPALRIIMEREREIRSFVPEKYFRLSGVFETAKKEKLLLECALEPKDLPAGDAGEKAVLEILETGRKNPWQVAEVKESEQKRSPRAPFTTSTLQQAASSRLGYSPSNTMRIAQKLYEAGHITYMRTDSTNLASAAQAQIISLIEKKYGGSYISPRVYKTKSKNAQEAHEAIRPTHIDNIRAGTEAEERLYRLVWERTVASQMADAKLLKTKISANTKSAEVGLLQTNFPDFTATGSRVIFDGWLRADPESRGEDVELPEVKKGEALRLIELSKEEKWTEPPGRYTEAGLIKELEARGIGRPSTYASIMKTLEDREYTRKEGKTLFPTDVGEVVSDFLEKNFLQYISDSFTAEMENELDEISRGEREYEKTLRDFYGPFLKEIKNKEKLEKATNLGEAPSDIKCPKCGNGMIIKLSRAGKFYSCARYPECSGALRLDGTKVEGPKETGEHCPECGVDKNGFPRETSAKWGGKLVIKERRDGSGTFISCSRYPKCKFIKKDEAEEARKRTGVICPICRNGDISERRGRFGIFYSCENYPNCKFAMKARPTGRTCKQCESLMMEGTKTIPERCSRNKCPNHRPDRIK